VNLGPIKCSPDAPLKRSTLVAASLGAAIVGSALVGGIPAGASTKSAPHSAAPTVITLKKNTSWGTILTLSNGDTVYRLSTDSKNKSVCNAQCATFWPPVLLAAGQMAPSGKGVTGLGSISRSGSARQITYKGVPLYRFVGDKTAGAITGNVTDSFGKWSVVNPADPTAAPRKTSAATASSTKSSGGSSTTTGNTGAISY
jgi:predicted lipoprotein with Yx(FWY)xxD motif